MSQLIAQSSELSFLLLNPAYRPEPGEHVHEERSRSRTFSTTSLGSLGEKGIRFNTKNIDLDVLRVSCIACFFK
jgi:hypothetical protein